MDWNALNAISTAVYAFFTIGLFVAATAAIVVAKRQLTQFHEQNQVEHLESLLKQFDAEPMISFRAALAHHRIDASNQRLRRLNADQPCPELEEILNFFEHVALLEKKHYLDLFGIWHTFSYWIFYYHADAREYIEQEQKEDKTFFDDFCTLVDKLYPIEKEKGGKSFMPSEDDRYEFYENEAKRVPGSPPIKSRKRQKR